MFIMAHCTLGIAGSHNFIANNTSDIGGRFWQSVKIFLMNKK